MTHRRLAVLALLASVALGACRRDPPPQPAPEAPPPQAAPPTTQPPPPPPSGPSAAELEAIERARASLTQEVYFDFDMSAIRSDAERVLRQKVDVLQASPAVRLRIEGHADERGSSEYNIALASRRAESVRQFFTGFGLAANRFDILSYGEERPAVNESNEAAWALNRRAEFVITAGADQIRPATNDR